jgi:quinol monooxygenase YgiN
MGRFLPVLLVLCAAAPTFAQLSDQTGTRLSQDEFATSPVSQYVVVELTVKEGELEKAKATIKTFVEAVEGNEAGVLLYYALQNNENPRQMTYVMAFENLEAATAHRQTAYIQEFVDALYPLCVEPPHRRGFSSYAGFAR